MSDTNLHNKQALYGIPASEVSDWLVVDRASEAANRMLHEAGGESILLSRMGRHQRRLWAPADISLDAAVLSVPFDPYNTQIALFASRESSTRTVGKLVVYSVVGNRINGEPSFIVPIDCPEELAYTVNAVAAWHEDLVELSDAVAHPTLVGQTSNLQRP